MNISKINSVPAFRGTLIVTDAEYNKVHAFDTKAITEIKKYDNGTRILTPVRECFVNKDRASFQDIAAAYNMAKDNSISIDLSGSMDFVV